jgi:pectate lyase
MIALFLAVMAVAVFPAPDFSIMGFAATGGGTTGGMGGQVVTPETLEELKTYAEDRSKPYVILIKKEFNTGKSATIGSDGAISSSGKSTTYGDIIRLGSNKTLVGIGKDAFFNRIGIVIQCQSNIIIRNIRFSMKDVPIARTDENKIVGWVNGSEKILSDPDCISIQADDESVAEANRISKNIWIDHCEFYNEDPDVMTDKDRYDGLIDGKNNSTNITISWCYFHDHHKGSLMGKGNSDDFDRRITYSHNYFRNISSRLPLIRFGKCHLLNNYIEDGLDGANARINSDLYIEANRFENTKKPVFGKISENGAATFVNNQWINCGRVPKVILSAGDGGGANALSESEELKAGSFRPSSFYSYTADQVSNIQSLIPAYCGVGKINTDEYLVTGIREKRRMPEKRDFAYVSGRRIIFDVYPGTPVSICDLTGKKIFSAITGKGSFDISRIVNNGIYIVKAGSRAERFIVGR